PGASVTCFEPSISNRTEAARVLDGQGIELIDDAAELSGTYDLITCCEVFEHLPEAQSAAALDHLRDLLTPKTGMLAVGVPNELYAVGLAKGLFRMSRRYGEYDANWRNVLACAVGRPPTDRVESEFEQLPYIFAHTGFDYRSLRAQLPNHGLRVRNTYGSPLRTLPVPVNSEAYFVCTRD
ncbi:MAG: class I SAM-dependent methyltransferase, partial [Acidimicrobiales bacterium]